MIYTAVVLVCAGAMVGLLLIALALVVGVDDD